MPNLTEDELAVLMIAARGESMMPLGRWEKPVKELAAKGYMQCLDASNYVITDTGRAACLEDDDASIRSLIEANNKVANVRTQIELSVREAAQHLFTAAKASHAVTNHAYATGVEEWGKVVIEEAKKLAAQELAPGAQRIRDQFKALNDGRD